MSQQFSGLLALPCTGAVVELVHSDGAYQYG